MNKINSQFEDLEHFPPELLNEKNRLLSLNIREKETKIRELQKELQEQQERLKVLRDHLKNVEGEIVQTQQIKEAKESEIQTEDHLRQLSEREIGRFRDEIKKNEQYVTGIQERLDVVLNDIFKANEKLDKFKTQMNFNQEELEQWSLAERQKEEDALAIEKYKRKDDAKIKEMSLTIENLNRIVEQKKYEFEAEKTETQAKQIELQKTAEDYKLAHNERQQYVDQWGRTIDRMNYKDNMIRQEGEKFAEAKTRLLEKQELLKQEIERLDINIQNNKEIEAKIEKINKEIEFLRDEITDMKTNINQMDDEIDVMKNTVAKTSNELNNQRSRNKVLTEQISEKQQKIKVMEKKVSEGKQTVEKQRKLLSKLEGDAYDIEEVLRKYEMQLKDVEKAISSVKEQEYRISQTLFKEKQLESNLVAEISGSTAQNRGMQSKIQVMDQEQVKQQELLYNIEFQIQQMERKVNRAQGERSEEESLALNMKIQELQTELDELSKVNATLTTEHKRLLGEIRNTQKRLDENTDMVQKLNSAVYSLMMENESTEVEIKKVTKEKEEMMIQQDILKLQQKRLQSILNSRTNELAGLENRKFQLEMAYQEKEFQVRAYKEILMAELKSAEEERRKIAMELSERRTAIDKLRTKFEILLRRMQPEDGEELSQAEFIIRSLQKKEELQAKGDKLDLEIQKLEKEDRGLEKTLQLFKDRNSIHMSSLKRIDETDERLLEKEELETKLQELDRIISRRLQEKSSFLEATQNKGEELNAMHIERREMETKAKAMQDSQTFIVQEVKEQYEKLETYKRLVQKDLKDMRKIADQPEVKDVALYEIKAKNKTALQLLALMAQNDIEFQTCLTSLMQEHDLKIPSQPNSARSSTTGSTRSSRASYRK